MVWFAGNLHSVVQALIALIKVGPSVSIAVLIFLLISFHLLGATCATYNNGEVAYQSVFHSHFHLIPRYTSDDDFKMIFKDNSGNYNDEKYKEIQQSIIDQMKED